MANKLIGYQRRKVGKEHGFTLLEYCAGAAVILIIVWVALQALGGSVSGLLKSIADWADRQTEVVNNR